jgi:hypothetical protein
MGTPGKRYGFVAHALRGGGGGDGHRLESGEESEYEELEDDESDSVSTGEVVSLPRTALASDCAVTVAQATAFALPRPRRTRRCERSS